VRKTSRPVMTPAEIRSALRDEDGYDTERLAQLRAMARKMHDDETQAQAAPENPVSGSVTAASRTGPSHG
jgi:hypothetical protein